MRPFKEKEELLVDYLEGELDSDSEKAIDFLLRHSELDKRIVCNLERTRDAIQVLDCCHVPESEDYYTKLHDKIMDRVETNIELRSNKKIRMAVFQRS